MIFEVAFPIPLLKTFDYLPPEGVHKKDLADWVGRRVSAPFGYKRAVGLITRLKDPSPEVLPKLKPVAEVLDSEPLLDETMLSLARWLGERYVSSWGEALFMILPPGKGKPRAFIDPEPAPRDDDYPVPAAADPVTLTPDQKRAIEETRGILYSKLKKGALLYGIAAAGKTEVYLAIAKDVLALGKSVLYLVPEIGLAHQTHDVLKDRFGEKAVLLWHSNKPHRERVEDWWRVKRGEFSIVVGVRSASLAPLAQLGAIIVDEEHDATYKEDRKPRFHAREVAFFRARAEGAMLLFGSATPSLEIMHEALRGDLHLCELTERAIPAGKPDIRLVDMGGSNDILSPSLTTAIGERVKIREQTILFLNRRGFFRYLRCPHCSWTARCPQCGVTLVYHKKERDGSASSGRPSSKRADEKAQRSKRDARRTTPGFLLCHYCSHRAEKSGACPQCQKKDLFMGGTGTQRVSEELKEKYPWARVLRWDRDTAVETGSQEKLFRQFQEGEGDVLIGTQMVAHGFNFPRVTLVGVVDADGPLMIPDFRASEKTFQLITQVAGRAGRVMVTGDVLVQTRHKEHYVIAHAARMDYKAFAAEELKYREELNYPPFSHLVQVFSEAKDSGSGEQALNQLIEWVEHRFADSSIGVMGPSAAFRARKRAKVRTQLFLKIPREAFEPFLKELPRFLRNSRRPFLIDVDPE